MESLGKGLLLFAAVAGFIGLVFLLLGKVGWQWRWLPGDIVVKRPGFTFVFPIVTCLVLSIALTVLLRLLLLFRR
jgi:hypothetical protein